MKQLNIIGVGLLCVALCNPTASYAQSVPSSADVGRIDGNEIRAIPNQLPQAEIPKGLSNALVAPPGSDKIDITIAGFDMQGVTVFDDSVIRSITQPYVDRPITLDQLWQAASDITSYYQERGYFLSRSFIPAQELEDGATVTIRMIEGRIGNVVFDDPLAQHPTVGALLRSITDGKATNVATLESVLLRLNDMPGINVRAVMEPSEEEGTANVQLLRVASDNVRGSIELNNFGSRFLGPYQMTASTTASIAPFHETQAYVSSSLPWDELAYGGVEHEWFVAPKWSLSFAASYVDSEPGYTLEANEIEGQSTEIGIGVTYQAIRQRRENLALSFFLEGQNSNTDILGTGLTRDRIRALRAILDYDTSDRWNGYNYVRATLSRGLGILGASDAGDLNLSRAAADPDFTTLNLSYVRQQLLNRDFLLVGQAQGQWASDPLFSAEEIGFGGQTYGRAYDPSEITGDHGLMGSVELRYVSFDPGVEWLKSSNTTPYLFYDVGKVWDRDPGASGGTSAMSAGAGIRMSHENGLNGELGVALPVSKPITNPIYGNGSQPRLIMKIGYDF